MLPYVSLAAMAERCDVSDTTVQRWETGESNPYRRQWPAIARGYEWPENHLAYLLARDDGRQDEGEPNPLEPWHHEQVDRRDFLAGSAVFAAAGLLPDTEPSVVGAEEVAEVESAVAAMERRDAAAGGGHMYGEAIRWRRRVERWLDRASYRAGVGDGLQAQLGALSAWAGWLAFDQGRYELAEHHLHDALMQARVTDDPVLEVRALAAMCLVYGRQNRPRMALQCADTGLRVASGWGTPRQFALLHLRRANAHARLGERSAFTADVAHAAKALDRGPHLDDPLHIQFVGPQELHSMVGASWLRLAEPDRAIPELRTILDGPDSRRQRNLALATVTLGRAIAGSGDITQASEIGAGVVDTVAALHSGRTAKDLAILRRTIDPHRSTVPAARDFAEQFDAAFA
jgi:helix-turn-helix protein